MSVRTRMYVRRDQPTRKQKPNRSTSKLPTHGTERSSAGAPPSEPDEDRSEPEASDAPSNGEAGKGTFTRRDRDLRLVELENRNQQLELDVTKWRQEAEQYRSMFEAQFEQDWRTMMPPGYSLEYERLGGADGRVLQCWWKGNGVDSERFIQPVDACRAAWDDYLRTVKMRAREEPIDEEGEQLIEALEPERPGKGGKRAARS